ncbi:putative galactinol--sucrose galactosyltransferase [Helianthus annuus]|nr:putative galactinol--sucrose galactosyltransferase [Helianthus annuus]
MAPTYAKVNGGVNLEPMVTLVGSNFMADGHPILSDVPSNITTCLTPSGGCFVGFDAFEPSSRHVVSIRKLSGIRFMSIFRFKVWWTTHWVGSRGRDLEHETQMVMLETLTLGDLMF